MDTCDQFEEVLVNELGRHIWAPWIVGECEEELFRLRRQAQLLPGLLRK
jgi:hypothetical protein